jgi:Concanavalin A-like lectin/glucanases superfamily
MSYIKRSAIWPDPRVKPPFGSVEIDWSHPLAQGLVSCFLLNEGGGAPVDLVTANSATIIPAILGFASGSGGPYFKNDNSGGFSTSSLILDVTSQPFSIVADFYPQSSEVDNFIVDRAIASVGGGGWSLTIAGGPGIALKTYQSDGGSQQTRTSLGSIVYNRLNRAIATRSGSSVKGYIDGAEPGYLIVGSHLDPSSVSLDATFGCFAGGGGPPGGTALLDGLDRALFYLNRVLSASDARWLNAEPYDFLRPLVRRRYWEPRRFLLGRH